MESVYKNNERNGEKAMSKEGYFWKASVEELKRGYMYDMENKRRVCLVCGAQFEDGIVYPIGEALYTSERAAAVHCAEAHGGMFDFFLGMRKVYTGLTEHQTDLMRMLYDGLTDKEIVTRTDATSTSTIRNQRFAFREKYKQAKIIVALAELLEAQRECGKRAVEDDKEGLIDIHRTATMLDERFAITQAEKEEVLNRYFDTEGKLVVKAFPAKEKKKIIILQRIVQDFTPNRMYTEKEVNEVVGIYYADIPTVRRYLIQYGFLDREKDGSTYWVKQ